MSPQRLALRTLMLGNARSMLAILLITASLCVLDLYAGHIASQRAELEYQAVIAQRLGHLAVLRGAAADGSEGEPMFAPQEAAKVRQLLSATEGVALAVPQMSVSGIASTGQRSTLFKGEGISTDADSAGTVSQQLPGKLNPGSRQGIALSRGQARTLGLHTGSNVTLTGASPDAPATSRDARVIDIYSGNGNPESSARHPLLMPLEMAQSLQGTERIERFVVYLNDPGRIEELRAALTSALRAQGIAVQVRSWKEQSPAWAAGRSVADVSFDSVACMVLAVIAATVAATMSINVFERRREVGTLRALGMRSSAVFLMVVMEGLWMALFGVAASLVASALIAWIVNRAALSHTAQHALNTAPMLVELDFNRMSMAVLAVLVVAMLAALVPALKAARAAVAPALSA